MIDVGLKSEGRVPLREFALGGTPAELKVGDTVEVFLERMEGRDGEASLSREKAKREESWVVLQTILRQASACHRHYLWPRQRRLHGRS